MDVEMLSLPVRTDILKALSDPNRIEILDMLSSRVHCNCHFQERLDLAANLLSYHLRVLRDAGLIVGTKRGRWVDYALAVDATDRIAAALPPGLKP
jgi:ArsR family transcriptional regulator